MNERVLTQVVLRNGKPPWFIYIETDMLRKGILWIQGLGVHISTRWCEPKPSSILKSFPEVVFPAVQAAATNRKLKLRSRVIRAVVYTKLVAWAGNPGWRTGDVQGLMLFCKRKHEWRVYQNRNKSGASWDEIMKPIHLQPWIKW